MNIFGAMGKQRKPKANEEPASANPWLSLVGGIPLDAALREGWDNARRALTPNVMVHHLIPQGYASPADAIGVGQPRYTLNDALFRRDKLGPAALAYSMEAAPGDYRPSGVRPYLPPEPLSAGRYY